jgi:hypothetical protein
MPTATAKKVEGLASALFAIQGEITKVSKGGKNPHFGSTYTTLVELVEALNPLFQKYDLLFSQVMDSEGGRTGLRTILMHVPTGEKIEGLALFPDGLNAQQTGSAVTYFRRYGIQSMLGVVSEDDDGNAASRPNPQAAPAQATSPLNEVVGPGTAQNPVPGSTATLPAASGGGLGGGVVL